MYDKKSVGANYWVFFVTSKLRYHPLALGCIFGLLSWILGLIMAMIFGLESLYFITTPLHLYAAGIAFAFYFGHWFGNRLSVMFLYIEPAFTGETNAYRSYATRWSRILFSMRGHLVVSSLFLIAAWILIVVFLTIEWLPWFPEEWSNGEKIIEKSIIVMIADIPVALLMGTGTYTAITFMIFTKKLLLGPHTDFDINPLLEITRRRLRSLNDFSFRAGLLGSFLVSLVALFFVSEFNIPALVGILTFSTIMFLMMIWPQVISHLALRKARERQLVEIESAILSLTGDKRPDREREQQVNFHMRRLREVSGQGVYVYHPSDLASVGASWLLPVGTFLGSVAIS